MYNDKDFLSGVVAGRALHGSHIGAEGGVITSGTLNVTANGTYDVTTYDKIDVAVPHPEYSVAKMLEGSFISVPCFTAGITILVYMEPKTITDTYIDWYIHYESISGSPAKAGDAPCLICPPKEIRVPGVRSGIITLPDFSITFNGPYMHSGLNHTTNCSVTIQKISDTLTFKEMDGRKMVLSDGDLYVVGLTGSGWVEHTFEFAYVVRTPIG